MTRIRKTTLRSASVQRSLTKFDGVSRLNVLLQPGRAIKNADANRATPKWVEAVISYLGYQTKLRPSDLTQGAKS